MIDGIGGNPGPHASQAEKNITDNTKTKVSLWRKMLLAANMSWPFSLPGTIGAAIICGALLDKFLAVTIGAAMIGCGFGWRTAPQTVTNEPELTPKKP